ncbi:MAG: hypothetical protein EKK39_04770 [Sphingobacteriales bacterium]|uniref:hypothetical protein n=1 Tax=Hydrotalea flava TaxID=714549 RepID=UPI00083374CA|nr:hypothetical protein [Hydrotalea flava]RTL54247.1 MAG: hypothetical protein EKK39_04770 [Sphingobacteriales bacterium]
MKRILLWTCTCLLFLTACNHHPKTTITSDDGKTKANVDLSGLSDEDDKVMGQKVNELKKNNSTNYQSARSFITRTTI